MKNKFTIKLPNNVAKLLCNSKVSVEATIFNSFKQYRSKVRALWLLFCAQENERKIFNKSFYDLAKKNRIYLISLETEHGTLYNKYKDSIGPVVFNNMYSKVNSFKKDGSLEDLLFSVKDRFNKQTEKYKELVSNHLKEMEEMNTRQENEIKKLLVD